MRVRDQFVAAFGVWEEALPYLDWIVDADELRLVVAMGGGAITAGQAAELLGVPPDAARDLLERAYRRAVVDREGGGPERTYAATSFYARLDWYAKFEGWGDIPEADRRRIDRRFLAEFVARHRGSVERKMQGLEAEHQVPNDAVVLLDEVEAMLDAAQAIVVQPCDCRRLGQNCDRPVGTCLALDEGARRLLDRGQGRSLTREEAKELVRWADRKGLMHTADSEWRARGLHAICNCCACDCYPFRAARELGSKGVWPRSRYLASYAAERCTQCGACVSRCHFAAFVDDGVMIEVSGRLRRAVRFVPEQCWGCGLCANTCPGGAIQMVALDHVGGAAPPRLAAGQAGAEPYTL